VQRSTQPSALIGMGNEYLAYGLGEPSVADWGGGMSAGCRPRIQLFAYAGNGWLHGVLWYQSTVHANKLQFARL